MKKNAFSSINDKGFTLVEMAVVLVIFGVLVSIGMTGMRLYVGNKAYDSTLTALDMNNAALIVFQATYRRYPCPADPKLAEDHPQYGYEDCALLTVSGRDANGDSTPDPVIIGTIPFNTLLDPNGDGNTADNVYNAALENMINAYGAGVVDKGLEALSNNDAPAEGKESGGDTGGKEDGGGDDTGGGTGIIGIGGGGNDTGGGSSGSGPTTTPPSTSSGTVYSGYTAYYGYDGWSNKITYAVTQSQTVANTFNQDYGAIDIQTEIRQSLLENPGSAHFVLVSHGENGKGAYTRGGKLVEQCAISVIDPTEPPPALTTIHEIENCNNNNALFVDGLKNDTRPRHYDDHLRYATSVITSLWGYSTPVMNDNGTPQTDDDFWMNRITNLNGGGVGVGTPTPEERLHIVGDLQALQVNTDKVCSEDNDDPSLCMPIAAIAGEMTDMQCPTGQVTVAIEDNKVKCVNPFASVPAGTCPPGQRAYGISSRDGLLCR